MEVVASLCVQYRQFETKIFLSFFHFHHHRKVDREQSVRCRLSLVMVSYQSIDDTYYCTIRSNRLARPDSNESGVLKNSYDRGFDIIIFAGIVMNVIVVN